MRILTILCSFCLTSPSIYCQEKIFDSIELLRFVLSAPFSELQAERYNEDFNTPGTISYGSNEIEVMLSVRGNYRRDENNCEFPPLLLRIKDRSDKMDRVKKIKLVTHCRNNPDFEKYLLKEYLVYRMYQQLTDDSFRVRLCHITYKEQGKVLFRRYAFLIEANKSLARRLKVKRIKNLTLPDEIPIYENTTLISFFQFMIGNTDWYLPDHNIRIYKDRQIGDTLVIAYDFDLCGFVNKPNSKPRPGLDIREIRERYYLGHCHKEEALLESIQHFQNHKKALLSIIDHSDFLSESDRMSGINYIREFYQIIEDPERLQKELISTCSSYY